MTTYYAYDRTVGYKRIYLIPNGQTPDQNNDPTQHPDPGHDQYVDVTVTTSVSMVSDGSEQYQEYEHQVDVSAQSGRTANDGILSHIDKVYAADVPGPTDPATIYVGTEGSAYQAQDSKVQGNYNGNYYQVGTISDFTNFIKVYRNDAWPIVMDGSDLFQEHNLGFDSVTGTAVADPGGTAAGTDTAPPHFAHLKTHIFRYEDKVNNPGTFVDVEVIDEYARVYDGSDQFQERNYIFNFTDVQPDPSWPCMNDLTGTIDPPTLLDPFQNIVNYKGKKYYWTFVYVSYNFGGAFVTADHLTLSVGSPPPTDFLGVYFIQDTTSTPTPPAVPEPPAPPYSDNLAFNTSGYPSSVPLDPAPSGFDGPFIRGATGGAYTSEISLVWKRVTSPFDEISYKTVTFDWSGITLTNTSYPGITWTPHVLDRSVSYTDVSGIIDGLMTLSPSRAYP